MMSGAKDGSRSATKVIENVDGEFCPDEAICPILTACLEWLLLIDELQCQLRPLDMPHLQGRLGET